MLESLRLLEYLMCIRSRRCRCGMQPAGIWWLADRCVVPIRNLLLGRKCARAESLHAMTVL